MDPRWPFTLALAGMLLVVGCAPSERSAAATDEAARATLESALVAWQQGSTPARLRVAEPSITVGDSAFSAGHRLDAFNIQPNPMDDGRNYRFTVLLTTTDPNTGESAETETAYEVCLEPVVTISRIE